MGASKGSTAGRAPAEAGRPVQRTHTCCAMCSTCSALNGCPASRRCCSSAARSPAAAHSSTMTSSLAWARGRGRRGCGGGRWTAGAAASSGGRVGVRPGRCGRRHGAGCWAQRFQHVRSARCSSSMHACVRAFVCMRVSLYASVRSGSCRCQTLAPTCIKEAWQRMMLGWSKLCRILTSRMHSCRAAASMISNICTCR